MTTIKVISGFIIFSIIIIFSFKINTHSLRLNHSIPSCQELKDSSATFSDGLFIGISRSRYVSEPYYGKVKVKIQNGKFKTVDFIIFDSTNHEIFDNKYEKHFIGNTLYIQQCRNDWNGVRTYPHRLLETLNLEKVDAISGATWSYNIFKAATLEALVKANKIKK